MQIALPVHTCPLGPGPETPQMWQGRPGGPGRARRRSPGAAAPATGASVTPARRQASQAAADPAASAPGKPSAPSDTLTIASQS